MATKDRVWARSVAMTDREWERIQRRAREKRISAGRYVRDCLKAAMDREDAGDD